MRSLILALCALAMLAPYAHAQNGLLDDDYPVPGKAAKADATPLKRFEHAKITAAQWQLYLDETRATPGAKIQAGADQIQITINSGGRNESYFFTTRGHAAHPAVVKVVAYVDQSGQTKVQIFGNYAGSKEGYDPWFFDLVSRVSQN